MIIISYIRWAPNFKRALALSNAVLNGESALCGSKTFFVFTTTEPGWPW